MMTSMTGFYEKIVAIPGEAQEQLPCFISIRSVNSRFLEVHCKVPSLLGFLEVPFINLCKQKLKRGSITLTMHFFSEGLLSHGKIRLRESLLKQYASLMEESVQHYPWIKPTVSFADVIRVPGMMIIEENLDTTTRVFFMHELEKVLDGLIAMRQEEGRTLLHDISKRLSAIQDHYSHIVQNAAVVMETKKRTVQEKLTALEHESPDLVNLHRTQLFIDLNKADLHEEIVRFENHYQVLKKYIQSAEEEKGRKIDFIVQEMNREINTISAKASDQSINTRAIEIKVELEKIREQAQNVL